MLPVAKNIQVNTKGAVILSEESPEVRDLLSTSKFLVIHVFGRPKTAAEYTFQDTSSRFLILQWM